MVKQLRAASRYHLLKIVTTAARVQLQPECVWFQCSVSRLALPLLSTATAVAGTCNTECHTGDSPPGGKENAAADNAAFARASVDSEAAQGSGQQPLSNGVRGLRRERSEGLAALLDSPDLPSGRAGPYAFRRQLGPTKLISNREPSLAHLAASNSADLGAVSHAMAHARSQPEQKLPKPGQPVQAAADSPKAKAAGVGMQGQQQQPFAGFAPSSSAGSQQAGSAAADQHCFLSPFSQANMSGLDPMDAFAHLPEGLRIQLQAPGGDDMSRSNSLVYNQVSPVRPTKLQLQCASLWAQPPKSAFFENVELHSVDLLQTNAYCSHGTRAQTSQQYMVSFANVVAWHHLAGVLGTLPRGKHESCLSV